MEYHLHLKLWLIRLEDLADRCLKLNEVSLSLQRKQLTVIVASDDGPGVFK